MSPSVWPILCRRDNYAYLVQGAGQDCFVVDPSEAEPVSRELARRGLRLRGILNTHHHGDHVAGNEELVAKWQVPVWGHVSDAGRIPAFSRALEEGESFQCAGLSVRAWHVPGHTQGGLLYVIDQVAFTGDTLFCGGCGRLLEGTASQLYQSLERMKQLLTPQTRIYTGHEYTAANLRFALQLEPEHPELRAREEQVRLLRQAGEFCASALWQEELQTNPFLRVGEAGLRRALGVSEPEDPEQVFAQLRLLKDRS